MNADTIHQMIRTFVGYGAPDHKDDVGPNKPDWPFFSRLAHQEQLDERELIEASERFHKYRNTQMPSILRDAGIDGSVDAFLSDLMQRGADAKEKYKREQEALRKKREAMRPFDKAVKQYIREHMLNTGQKPDLAHVLLEYEEQSHMAIGEQYAMDLLESTSVPTITAFHVNDVWKNRYGREFTSVRIGLSYPFNTDWNNILKSVAPFPKVKFNGDLKKWTIENTQETLDLVRQRFKEEGVYINAEQLTAEFNQAKPEAPSVTQVSARLQGSSIILQWPFIQDPTARNRTLSFIKETQGRKFNPDDKTWSIALSEASPLVDRIRKANSKMPHINEIADAIEAIPEVASYMRERAERIAISSASILDDDEAIQDIKDILIESFPDDRELYPFQYVGVKFAQLAHGRALIGDDMGIGKTIQAIAHIALNMHNTPALVVCPASVKYNWEKEVKAWLPEWKVEVLSGWKGDIPRHCNVVIANYDLISRRREQLLDYGFNIVVCDESHYLKNSKAQRTQAVLEIAKQSESVICLSGTAITNRPNEFYTTLNLLRPNEFSNFYEYGKRYCDGHQKPIGRGKFAWDFNGASNTDELHNRTRDFCIRRLKSEVLTELPAKVRSLHYINPTSQQSKDYNALLRKWLDEYDAHRHYGTLPKGFVLNMLTDLRHECGRMKVEHAIQYVKDYVEISGKPIVVFAHHRDILQAIFTTLREDENLRGMVGAIAGDMPAQKRQQQVEAFQRGDLMVLVCSTIAAKEGITLTASDTTLFVEREWVPAYEEQAEDRVNRIGQESNSVSAVYLSVEDTIDEKFNYVIEQKRKVVQAVLDGGTVDERVGISNMLIAKMIQDGDIPSDFLEKKKRTESV